MSSIQHRKVTYADGTRRIQYRYGTHGTWGDIQDAEADQRADIENNQETK